MNLLRFFIIQSATHWKRILAAAILSGLANGTLLIVINSAAYIPPTSEEHFRFLLLYMLAMVLFIYAKRYALTHGIRIAEDIIKRLRLRVVNKIRTSELLHIESLDRGMVHTKLTQDINYISQTTIITIHACQEAIMVFFAMIYLWTLSRTVFFITISGIALAVYFFYLHRRSTIQDLRSLTAKESELFNTLDHVLSGFKEVRLNRRRSLALNDVLTAQARETERLKVKTGLNVVTDVMFSQIFFYTLIAIIIFLLPQIMPSYGPILMKVTVAVLFIIAPLEVAVNAAPFYMRASVALHNIQSLECELDAHRRGLPATDDLPAACDELEPFQLIRMENAVFNYRDQGGVPLFTVGPMDLTIQRGDVVFFVGGNGSGKSTVLKLLTGLYPFESGHLWADQQRIGSDRINAYRNLFAAIFSDFHLFDRLYGQEAVDADLVRGLIHSMELDGKTDFHDGQFSDLHLSTGQRKRLALIAELIEDKPIYVFDEWAADQDSHFRERFYHVTLKELKQRGKTVLAVTHDDRYWHVADHVYRLDYGKMREITIA